MSGGDGDVTCSGDSSNGCDLQYCLLNSDPCSGYYVANGKKFPANACDEDSVQSAAVMAVSYCSDGSSDEEDSSGCTVSPNAPWSGMVALFTVGLAFLGGRRRRR
jgi:MYXO-CTERM domain-containing protein